MTKVYIFPATGPSFINSIEHDEEVYNDIVFESYKYNYNPNSPIASLSPKSIRKLLPKTWLIGSSTGALRAMSIFYGNTTNDLADKYCDMVWYPWSTPYSLGQMLRNNVRTVMKGKNRCLIDIPTSFIPAIIVTHFTTPPWIPYIFIVMVCAIANLLFGIKDLIYSFATMYIYIPEWCDKNDFPLIFENHIKHEFKKMNSDNIDEVLYSTTRIPFLSCPWPGASAGASAGTCKDNNSANCDGAFMFYYLNGIPKSDVKVTLLSDVMNPTRSILDNRGIYHCDQIWYKESKNSILDWFYPPYVLCPDKRKKKWKGCITKEE